VHDLVSDLELMSRNDGFAEMLTDAFQNTVQNASAVQAPEFERLVHSQERELPAKDAMNSTADAEVIAAVWSDVEPTADWEAKTEAYEYDRYTSAYRATEEYQWVTDSQSLPLPQSIATISDVERANQIPDHAPLPDWELPSIPRQPTGLKNSSASDRPVNSLALSKDSGSPSALRIHPLASYDHPVASSPWGNLPATISQPQSDSWRNKSLPITNGLGTLKTDLPFRSDGVRSASGFTPDSVFAPASVFTPEKVVLPTSYGSNRWASPTISVPVEKNRLPPLQANPFQTNPLQVNIDDFRGHRTGIQPALSIRKLAMPPAVAQPADLWQPLGTQ